MSTTVLAGDNLSTIRCPFCHSPSPLGLVAVVTNNRPSRDTQELQSLCHKLKLGMLAGDLYFTGGREREREREKDIFISPI
jgi:hypothetical protein